MENRDRLTGMLIGLARATFGNYDIITPDTYPTMIQALAADDSRTEAMIELVEKEKYTIVPDCAVCTVKCGRNEDFDMAKLDSEPAEEKQLKLQLIATARQLATVTLGKTTDREINSYLTKALMMAGTENLPAEFLHPVVKEGRELVKKHSAL